jgi:formylglycine-generating enzyme required for sulfatase activity
MGLTNADANRIAADARSMILNGEEREVDFNPIDLNAEMPQHTVTITKPFYFGKYEMTAGQWNRIMNPESPPVADPNRAASSIQWEEMQALLLKLNEANQDTKIHISLPTEAQWELACRAGTTSDYYFGKDRKQMADYAWFNASTADQPQQVGQLKPNAWGLYDMLGNVSEWCSDGFDRQHYAVSGRYDPQGFNAGAYWRIHRGGSWLEGAFGCRVTARHKYDPKVDYPQIGVRLVISPVVAPVEESRP